MQIVGEITRPFSKETSNAPFPKSPLSQQSWQHARELFQQPPAPCQAAPGQKATEQDRALHKALMLEEHAGLTSRSHSWETHCSEETSDRQLKDIKIAFFLLFKWNKRLEYAEEEQGLNFAG